MEDTSGAKFSPKETKSKAYCCVYGCNSKACDNPTLRFHNFPKANVNFVKVEDVFGNPQKIDCRKMWQQTLKIGKTISTYMQVCSLHFKRSDYILPDSVPQLLPIRTEVESKKRRYLKKTAIPSCNLPVTNVGESNSGRGEMKFERCKRRFERESRKFNLENGAEAAALEEIEENEDVLTAVNQPEENETAVLKQFADFGAQVKSGDLMKDFCELIESNSELNTLTGIASFDLLNVIIDIVKLAYPKYRSNRSNLRSMIIMTLMKLKHNMSYSVLSIFFKYLKISQCRKTIMRMIDVLSNCLTQDGIPFPSRDEISRNIPICFNNFLDVRIVLDCTEVFIQKPKNLCCQIATFSHYKGTFTIKFMTGITPGGLISYVSKLYGGRASDKAIFEQSGIIHRLEKGDAIMVDKGFLIDELCKDNDIKLIRPPFLKDKRQFSNEEALLNAEIAKARVHIERSNQRLKMFKILSTRMPVGLVKKSQEIFNIIAVIVNLSTSILKDDKFNS